mmetsp:Transcript_23808/g.93600  ORF Transcript_23808/g.93600 Transcript_23808/m.93600 type:complete len:396 (-) Transcript_23808:41-1228(-)|eukprot:CAMPEP_0113958938 /NCGR_PEP_ID=MMETSP0011_2-20120614/3830_1 /TAXON_ID=101924 /ORGANISM="Rhodosorus marinus" /LENGTH=395 /DNA_ID=CAMNT_0000970121 /DNA_START=706 /DNA_END=1893 /DNA_ORIENTATION=- /assembly_acc=CAM_ASM_000156
MERLESFRSASRVRIGNPTSLESANLTFLMRDGRTVSVAEAGKPDGVPVFMMYGLGGSRLFVYYYNDIGVKLGLRLISADRPGRGLSTNQEKRTFMDWALDVEEIASQMKLPCFGLWGFSVGALHALACACHPPLAEKILGKVIVVSTWAPPDTAGSKKRIKMLKYLPTGIQRSIPLVWNKALERLTEKQKKFLEKDFNGELLPEDELYFNIDNEARRQGTKGFTEEFMMCCRSQAELDFDLASVLKPVRMYAGVDDTLVSILASRLLAFKIPECDYTEVPGVDHDYLMRMSAVEYVLTEQRDRFLKEAVENFAFGLPPGASATVPATLGRSDQPVASDLEIPYDCDITKDMDDLPSRSSDTAGGEQLVVPEADGGVESNGTAPDCEILCLTSEN